MTIEKREGTRIPGVELTGMKLDRIGGATWVELEEKYGYHRTTIMRAVSKSLHPSERAKGSRRNIRMTESQMAAYNEFGRSAYVRSLIDRDIAERAKQ